MTVNGIGNANGLPYPSGSSHISAKGQNDDSFAVSATQPEDLNQPKPTDQRSRSYNVHAITRQQVRTMANELYFAGSISLKDDARLFIMSGSREVSPLDDSRIDLVQNMNTYIQFLHSIGQSDLASRWQSTLNDLNAVTAKDGTVDVAGSST